MPDLSSEMNLPLVRRVELFDELDSTNNYALALADPDPALLPLLVVARRQTAGRGRGENRWWAAEGSLTFSLLLGAEESQLPPARWPLVSLAAAISVGEALRDFAKGGLIQLKWPNDVFLGGKKICGILVESPPTRPARLVVGIGLNVNNSLASAPADVQAVAASLCDAAGQTFSRAGVLSAILARFAEHWSSLVTGTLPLKQLWQEHCYLRGRTIQISSGRRSDTGVCLGLADDGAILLQSETGVARCLAGVVTRID